MSSEQSRFLGVTEEIGARGEIEVFHLDTKEDSNGALVHTIDDVDEVWTRERRPLGAGGFGVAWLEKSPVGKVRVVKEVKKIVNTNVMTEYWLRELSAMALLHRNTKYFPRFYGWFHDKDYVYIAMEHVNQGDLRQCVTCPLPGSQPQSIVKQVAQALRILHKKDITHRDLKPANILVRQGPAPSWRVVITDFGISKRVRDPSTSLHSSFGGDTTFMAPEILGWATGDADEYTNAVDMWSLGCLAYWLLKMNAPVSIPKMVSYCKTPWPKAAATVEMTGIDESGKDFILSLISPDPDHRMNAEEACAHVWLESISLSTTATSFRPKEHNAAVPQAERALVRKTAHSFEERVNSAHPSAQQTITLGQGEKINDSPPPAPGMTVGDSSPGFSQDPHTRENRAESPQRESRPRETSTKLRVSKKDDALPTRNNLRTETRTKRQSSPRPRPLRQPSPRPSGRDQRSAYNDDSQDDDRYVHAYRSAQDYVLAAQRKNPRPLLSREGSSVDNYWYTESGRDRKSGSDSDKQRSSSSQRPSRKSVPNESKLQPSLSPGLSAARSHLKEHIYFLSNYNRREMPTELKRSPSVPVPQKPQAKRDGAPLKGSTLKQTGLMQNQDSGYGSKSNPQTSETRHRSSSREIGAGDTSTRIRVGEDDGYFARSDPVEPTKSRSPMYRSPSDRGSQPTEQSVTPDSRGTESRDPGSTTKGKPRGAWGREGEKPPMSMKTDFGIAAEEAKAQAAKERDARERIYAYTVPRLTCFEYYSEGVGSSGTKERSAQDIKDTYTRQASAYVDDYSEDDEDGGSESDTIVAQGRPGMRGSSPVSSATTRSFPSEVPRATRRKPSPVSEVRIPRRQSPRPVQRSTRRMSPGDQPKPTRQPSPGPEVRSARQPSPRPSTRDIRDQRSTYEDDSQDGADDGSKTDPIQENRGTTATAKKTKKKKKTTDNVETRVPSLREVFFGKSSSTVKKEGNSNGNRTDRASWLFS